MSVSTTNFAANFVANFAGNSAANFVQPCPQAVSKFHHSFFITPWGTDQGRPRATDSGSTGQTYRPCKSYTGPLSCTSWFGKHDITLTIVIMVLMYHMFIVDIMVIMNSQAPAPRRTLLLTRSRWKPKKGFPFQPKLGGLLHVNELCVNM